MKPKTDDGINFTMIGCTIKVLDIDDVLRADDYVRPYYESPMASESGGWDRTWKNDKWRGTFWHLVGADLRGWVGKTYGDYLDLQVENGMRYASDPKIMQDEIVRLIQ